MEVVAVISPTKFVVSPYLVCLKEQIQLRPSNLNAETTGKTKVQN